MRRRHLIIAVLSMFLFLPQGFACSCSNSTPIQKSAVQYTRPDGAVFTARIIGLIGQVYLLDGKRASSQALAMVYERKWGLPWYWPRIVLLDGSYPCDTAMFPGEEYLVAGFKVRYGVVMVNGCSRTQPLKTAYVDLRTLDGTHCSGPGGTLIGRIPGEWDKSKGEYLPFSIESVAFTDVYGKTYRSSVNENGVYELQHLPSVLYAANSRIDSRRYLATSIWENLSFPSLTSVQKERCLEYNLVVRQYQVTGKLPPGIGTRVTVELTTLKPGSEPIRALIEPDGRFYFHKLPVDKYLLSVVANLGDHTETIFYPGVKDPAQAIQIFVDGQREAGRSFDFDARVLPLVPIRVVLDASADPSKYLWDFQLQEKGAAVTSSRTDGSNFGLLFGKRGASYLLHVHGYAHNTLKDNDCTSESLPLNAVEGPPVHITVSCVP